MNEEERNLLANIIRSLTAAVTLNIPLDEGELGEVESLFNSLRHDTKEEKSNESENKLLSALKTIREECKKHESCKNCPLRRRNNRDCTLYDSTPPEEWLFKYEDGTDGYIQRLFD